MKSQTVSRLLCRGDWYTRHWRAERYLLRAQDEGDEEGVLLRRELHGPPGRAGAGGSGGEWSVRQHRRHVHRRPRTTCELAERERESPDIFIVLDGGAG